MDKSEFTRNAPILLKFFGKYGTISKHGERNWNLRVLNDLSYEEIRIESGCYKIIDISLSV